MHLTSHLLMGWLSAKGCGHNKKDTRVVTLASLAPDVDGVGLLWDLMAELGGVNTHYWSWHHSLHNVFFALLVGALAGVYCRSLRVAGLCVLVFHLHLLCDLLGSGGPDGFVWPIPYLAPLCDTPLIWQGQWALNAWPNLLIGMGLFLLTWWVVRTQERSPFELFSSRLDQACVGMVKRLC